MKMQYTKEETGRQTDRQTDGRTDGEGEGRKIYISLFNEMPSE